MLIQQSSMIRKMQCMIESDTIPTGVAAVKAAAATSVNVADADDGG